MAAADKDAVKEPKTAIGAQSTRARTAENGLYVWVYPKAYDKDGVPRVVAMAEGPNPQNREVVVAQIEGTPTNRSVTVRVTRLAPRGAFDAMTIIPGAAFVHIVAGDAP